MESHKIPWFQSPPSSDSLWVFSIQHFHQCGLLGDCWALDNWIHEERFFEVSHRAHPASQLDILDSYGYLNNQTAIIDD